MERPCWRCSAEVPVSLSVRCAETSGISPAPAAADHNHTRDLEGCHLMSPVSLLSHENNKNNSNNNNK